MSYGTRYLFLSISGKSSWPFNFSQNSQLMSSRNTLQNNLMNNSENFLYIVYEF
jgi:hypothetical protein